MDPYITLGVRRNAAARTVTKAYRKMAMEHHPDRGGEPEKFAAIQRAYEVLRDPARRKRFDETGDCDNPQQRSEFAVVGGVLANVLMSLVQQAVAGGIDVDRENMADHARKFIRQAQIKLRETERTKMQELAAWRKMQARWKNKKDEQNLLAGLVAGMIVQLERQVGDVGRELDGLAKALAFMEGVTYQFDQEVRRMVMMQWGSATTSATSY